MTSESAYLTWKAPEDNGGAVISHYIVEKKDVAAEQWVPVSAAHKKRSLMAMYLMEGIQYLFRVAAENQFGRSDYVVTKTPIKAVDPLCECTAVFPLFRGVLNDDFEWLLTQFTQGSNHCLH